MDFKMIAMDLDDTLLRNDLTISSHTRDIILQAQKNGVIIVLASGRPTYAMRHYAKLLKLQEYGGYILSYNGSVILDCAKDKVLFESCLSRDNALELHKLSQEHNVFYHTYVGDQILTTQNNAYTEIERELTGMNVIEVDDLSVHINCDPVKVLMLENPEYLKEVEERLRPLVEEKMSIYRSKPFFLEFTDKGIDKGNMLDKLAAKLKIMKEQIIAIGDGYNDLSMIRYAGLGVAMANANDEIKAEADYVTKSNMEDGVAKVIKKFIFEKRSVA